MTMPHAESRAMRPGPVAVTEHPRRWMLNRAGIINVYQYGNETLHFGGGRLLLRGVNGSGKSTAMNMLLPFLLDGDTRRIDAAGEQSGVLKAWMLSGRDEPQPQGYLWLEIAKGDAYLSFGCGIRANRSTDQVTTWWFITSRRVGLDLQLVEGRVPVSREALRTLIEPNLVFSQEQRADYRAELRRRLFGGADIEQHLHLLRTVRNPRVGDRLDAELPQYLQDALPQLSDSALDDAAQPLEDLEEHRRNVAELKRTAEVLEALHATYRNYARAELHRQADRALEAARRSRTLHRDEEKARTLHTEAVERRGAAESRKRELGAAIEGLRSAIAALEGSEAYKSGAQLNDLREHVQSLERLLAAAKDELLRRRSATGRSATAVISARRDVESDHGALSRRIADLAHLATACGLAARPAGLPPIAFHPDSPDDLPLAPADSIETTAANAALSALSAAARQRLEDVQTVESAFRAIEPADRAVREAQRAADEAQSANDAARNALAEARAAFQLAVEEWQAAVTTWLERVRYHQAACDLSAIETLAELGAIVDAIVNDRPAPISRVDLAARVLGSAHALDSGTRVEAAVARALAFKLGPADHRDLWAQAGVHFDLTSAPVLTWRLPLTERCGLAHVTAGALDAAIPFHLSRLALEKYPADVPRASRILVVENPRVVEAAAQVQAAIPVVSTNGRPSSTVLLLLTQLLDAGAELRYHGDFDTAGLAICERMMSLGLTPWRMSKADYCAALEAADTEGTALPKDQYAPGPTPWDPALREVFDRQRRIVHEERLLPGLLE